MSGSGAALATDALGLLAASETPLQALGPSTLTDAPWPFRGLAAFLVVVGLGGVLVWRYEPFVDRSIDASMERPLSSLGHGAAAHAVIVFVGVYLANKFGRYAPLDGTGPLIGLSVGLLLLVGSAAVGFTVVGSTIVELRGDRQRWLGLALGGAIAGAAGAVATTTGAFVWFVVVSMGIGGAVRRWINASAVPER